MRHAASQVAAIGHIGVPRLCDPPDPSLLTRAPLAGHHAEVCPELARRAKAHNVIDGSNQCARRDRPNAQRCRQQRHERIGRRQLRDATVGARNSRVQQCEDREQRGQFAG